MKKEIPLSGANTDSARLTPRKFPTRTPSISPPVNEEFSHRIPLRRWPQVDRFNTDAFRPGWIRTGNQVSQLCEASKQSPAQPDPSPASSRSHVHSHRTRREQSNSAFYRTESSTPDHISLESLESRDQGPVESSSSSSYIIQRRRICNDSMDLTFHAGEESREQPRCAQDNLSFLAKLKSQVVVVLALCSLLMMPQAFYFLQTWYKDHSRLSIEGADVQLFSQFVRNEKADLREKAVTMWMDHVVIDSNFQILIPESFQSRFNAEVAPLMEPYIDQLWNTKNNQSSECLLGEKLMLAFSMSSSADLNAYISFDGPCPNSGLTTKCMHKRAVSDIRDLVVEPPARSSRFTHTLSLQSRRPKASESNGIRVLQVEEFGIVNGLLSVELSDGSRLALQRYCGTNRKLAAMDLTLEPVSKDTTRIVSLYELKRLFNLISQKDTGNDTEAQSWERRELSKITLSPLEHSRHALTLSHLKQHILDQKGIFLISESENPKFSFHESSSNISSNAFLALSKINEENLRVEGPKAKASPVRSGEDNATLAENEKETQVSPAPSPVSSVTSSSRANEGATEVKQPLKDSEALNKGQRHSIESTADTASESANQEAGSSNADSSDRIDDAEKLSKGHMNDIRGTKDEDLADRTESKTPNPPIATSPSPIPPSPSPRPTTLAEKLASQTRESRARHMFLNPYQPEIERGFNPNRQNGMQHSNAMRGSFPRQSGFHRSPQVAPRQWNWQYPIGTGKGTHVNAQKRVYSGRLRKNIRRPRNHDLRFRQGTPQRLNQKTFASSSHRPRNHGYGGVANHPLPLHRNTAGFAGRQNVANGQFRYQSSSVRNRQIASRRSRGVKRRPNVANVNANPTANFGRPRQIHPY